MLSIRSRLRGRGRGEGVLHSILYPLSRKLIQVLIYIRLDQLVTDFTHIDWATCENFNSVAGIKVLTPKNN